MTLSTVEYYIGFFLRGGVDGGRIAVYVEDAFFLQIVPLFGATTIEELGTQNLVLTSHKQQ